MRAGQKMPTQFREKGFAAGQSQRDRVARCQRGAFGREASPQRIAGVGCGARAARQQRIDPARHARRLGLKRRAVALQRYRFAARLFELAHPGQRPAADQQDRHDQQQHHEVAGQPLQRDDDEADHGGRV